jgi:hypothetical protein
MNYNKQANTGNTPFQNLDAISALTEISDGTAATCRGGATADFKGLVVGPPYGISGLSTVYTTTPEFKDISIRMLNNPADLEVVALTANGNNQISSYKKVPANYRGVVTLAKNVLDGTRFTLGFKGSSQNPVNVVGRITY